MLAVFLGLTLCALAPGEKWINASYDNLFRFDFRKVTNQVVVILMDNEAYTELTETRDRPWDRSLHTKLLNKLADDSCPLVVMDVFFRKMGDPASDQALIIAMSRLSNLVLAAEQSGVTHRGLESVRATLPAEPFQKAGHVQWGVAWLDPDLDMIVRRHWPFPNPGPYPGLPWEAARISGARLDEAPSKRWIRYYNSEKAWTSLSYHLALTKVPDYFRGKTVFIGTKPSTPLPDNERDEFRSPHFNWTGETVGGVEILATCFLNLANGDSLQRMPWPAEELILVLVGGFLSWALCRFRPAPAIGVALGIAVGFTIAGVYLSYFTNIWFPWVIVVGGQLPCALAWSLVPIKIQTASLRNPNKPPPDKTVRLNFPEESLPDAPEYELITPHIGQGGFGKVWIARNAIGQWQALKAVYQSSFGNNTGPYDAEFKGLQRYKPVSEKHPGLLRIDLVSKKKNEGYFYYVMELGDAQTIGWEKEPQLYKPRDLENLRKAAAGRQLPPPECLRIVTVLADALNFLHEQGLTHRDIKPSNVIFVKGRPKLADVGLVADIRPLDEMKTMIGTPGYMPPPPEKPGTPQADIYAMGMLFYVILTGSDPGFFPEIATALIEKNTETEFIRPIILKACEPDIAKRYQTTAEMWKDLQEAATKLPVAANLP